MSVRPRLSRTASRSALAALALTAAVGGAVVASGPAAADPAGTAAAVPTVMLGSVPAKPTGPVTSSAGYDFYAGYLAGGATGRY